MTRSNQRQVLAALFICLIAVLGIIGMQRYGSASNDGEAGHLEPASTAVDDETPTQPGTTANITTGEEGVVIDGKPVQIRSTPQPAAFPPSHPDPE